MKELVLTVILFMFAKGLFAERISLESKQVLPDSHHLWNYGSDVPDVETVKLVFALKQQNLETLEELFWAVSDPQSPGYGSFLSLDEISALVKPSLNSIKLLLSWLAENQVKQCETVETEDFIICEMSSAIAGVLLDTEFAYFQHEEDPDMSILRAKREYTVPSHIAPHLDFIGGLHRVPNTHNFKPKNVKQVTDFRYGVHPDTLRKRYNVSDHVGTHPNNSQGTAQFLNQHYSPTDLKEFMYIFGGSFPHLTEVSKEVGPNKGKTGLEANLDVQYIMSLGANISTTFWSTGGLHEKQEPFLEWILALSNTSHVPPVFSVSYGDHERTLSPEYMKRINVEFQKIGLRGVSVLFASGDDGAGCHYFNETSFTFEPDFPASSPYVTTVGGTEFTHVFSDNDEKSNDISGGGFSNIFEMPKYQQDVVSGYLNNSKLPDAKYFNPTMRAYPDVAAMSDDFWIIINRLMMNVAGTSAATPTVAGMIALANDARLHAGKPTLGFLNPFIYQHPEIFYDITQGEPSESCWLEDLEGYNVAPGWDPVTGFGTPDYDRLIKAAMRIYDF